MFVRAGLVILPIVLIASGCDADSPQAAPAATEIQAEDVGLPYSAEQPGAFDPPLSLPAAEVVRIDAILTTATLQMPSVELQELSETAIRPSTHTSQPLARAIRAKGGHADIRGDSCRGCASPIRIRTSITVAPDFSYQITSVVSYDDRQSTLDFARSAHSMAERVRGRPQGIRPHSVLINSLHADLRAVGVNLCASVTGNLCESGG